MVLLTRFIVGYTLSWLALFWSAITLTCTLFLLGVPASVCVTAVTIVSTLVGFSVWILVIRLHARQESDDAQVRQP